MLTVCSNVLVLLRQPTESVWVGFGTLVFEALRLWWFGMI